MCICPRSGTSVSGPGIVQCWALRFLVNRESFVNTPESRFHDPASQESHRPRDSREFSVGLLVPLPTSLSRRQGGQMGLE